MKTQISQAKKKYLVIPMKKMKYGLVLRDKIGVKIVKKT